MYPDRIHIVTTEDRHSDFQVEVFATYSKAKKRFLELVDISEKHYRVRDTKNPHSMTASLDGAYRIELQTQAFQD